MLLRPRVAEFLRRYERLEVYTDNKVERDELQYDDAQKRITGYNANPTYIVLDSKNLLEVARESYTQNENQFLGFLKRGLEDRPAFKSWVRYDPLVSLDGVYDAPPAQLEKLSDESDPGKPFTYIGQQELVYRGPFHVRQTLRVPKELPPGHYRLRARFFTGLYEGQRWIRTDSVEVPLDFEVLSRG